jgi:hypothetical protein
MLRVNQQLPQWEVDIDLRQELTPEEIKTALSAGWNTEHPGLWESAGDSTDNIGK